MSPEESAKTQEKPLKLTSNMIAYMALREQGLSKQGAARELGLSLSYPAYVETRLKGKYDLTNTGMVKLAHKAVKKLVKGQTFGTIEKVKDSTALAAAAMIMDRDQPTINLNQNMNLNADVSFIQESEEIDMSSYYNDLEGQGSLHGSSHNVTYQPKPEPKSLKKKKKVHVYRKY